MSDDNARDRAFRHDPLWLLTLAAWSLVAVLAMFDLRFVVAAGLIGLALLLAIGYRVVVLLGSSEASTERSRQHLEALEWLLRERPATPESARPAAPALHAGPGVDTLNVQIESAKVANDPQRVLDLFGQLAPFLSEPDRAEREQAVARDLLALLMRRLRGGTVSVDVATLAEHIAEAFAATREGASLRASLPTLRRSAGLCPQCAKPYAGEDRMCPECTAAPAAPASPTELPPAEGDPDQWQPDAEVADLRRELGEEE